MVEVSTNPLMISREITKEEQERIKIELTSLYLFISLFINYLLLSLYLHSTLPNLNGLKTKFKKHDKIKLHNKDDTFTN